MRKLIDREPTEEMLELALKQRLLDALINCPEKAAIRKLYQAMFDAAPEPVVDMEPVAYRWEQTNAAYLRGYSYVDKCDIPGCEPLYSATQLAALQAENERLEQECENNGLALNEEARIHLDEMEALQAENEWLRKEVEELKQQVLEQQAHIRLLHTKLTSNGPRCRDCADEDGICPTYGVPCDWNDNLSALESALKAERLAGKIEGMEEAEVVVSKNIVPVGYTYEAGRYWESSTSAAACQLRRMAAELKEGK